MADNTLVCKYKKKYFVTLGLYSSNIKLIELIYSGL